MKGNIKCNIKCNSSVKMCFIIYNIQNFPEGDTVISVDSESLLKLQFLEQETGKGNASR